MAEKPESTQDTSSSAKWPDVPTPPPIKTDFFIRGVGGGASVHRLVQSGVVVEYVVLTSTLPFPVSTGTCGDKLNYVYYFTD